METRSAEKAGLRRREVGDHKGTVLKGVVVSLGDVDVFVVGAFGISSRIVRNHLRGARTADATVQLPRGVGASLRGDVVRCAPLIPWGPLLCAPH